ncbi:MAG TPA: ABC transporter ATP-binding protein [Bryobacteraceae bacterium]|nr:ABC transporter ATP-binding protein [Bryobacteraceae bacterium]
MPAAALAAQDLTIHLTPPGRAEVPIVRGVSFEIAPGSIAGLFGESGCGKTTLALALLRLLPPERYRVRGSVRIADREILSASERELESIRGARISMVFQDPLLALNPVIRVQDQLSEVVRAHRANAAPSDLLELAGLAPSARILSSYPHQLSGGERQRVAIAQALACQPSVVIADEPFTALDAVRVVELLALFRSLRDRLGTAFLVITHHPGILANLADQVFLMQRGVFAESGPPRQVLRQFAGAARWGGPHGA